MGSPGAFQQRQCIFPAGMPPRRGLEPVLFHILGPHSCFLTEPELSFWNVQNLLRSQWLQEIGPCRLRQALNDYAEAIRLEPENATYLHHKVGRSLILVTLVWVLFSWRLCPQWFAACRALRSRVAEKSGRQSLAMRRLKLWCWKLQTWAAQSRRPNHSTLKWFSSSRHIMTHCHFPKVFLGCHAVHNSHTVCLGCSHIHF